MSVSEIPSPTLRLPDRTDNTDEARALTRFIWPRTTWIRKPRARRVDDAAGPRPARVPRLFAPPILHARRLGPAAPSRGLALPRVCLRCRRAAEFPRSAR